MQISDNRLLQGAAQQLARCLPPGWTVEQAVEPVSADTGLYFTSSEGRSRRVDVSLARRLDPRRAREMTHARTGIIIAPYLSKSVRDLLESQGMSYADHTGNLRVIIEEPGLFIYASGADSNPWPETHTLSLKGRKAGQVVRTLTRVQTPIGVRALAARTNTNPGYVSRLLQMLDREALIDRTSSGQVDTVDWRRLLERWADDAPLDTRAAVTTWIAPRGLPHLLDTLSASSVPHLVTGSVAAAGVAPIAPARLFSLYVKDAQAAASSWSLRSTARGANVILLESDEDIFDIWDPDERGLRRAPLSLVVADLLTGPGRAPSEASALMDWMEQHEEAWRE